MGRSEAGRRTHHGPDAGATLWIPDDIIVTCEHAGRAVPREFAGLFRGRGELLRSHRGWDIGALKLAEHLAVTLGVAPHLVSVSRLVVDVNRSIKNRTVFSEVMRDVDERARERIIASYYLPHRRGVERAIASPVRAGRRVLHVSVHTFTPVMKGYTRKVDVGVLFDPARRSERAMSDAWIDEMKTLAPELLIRRNLPYRGTSDGFTTCLRAKFPAAMYAGLEIELNNRIAGGSAGVTSRQRAFGAISAGLLSAIGRGSCAQLRR